MSYEEAHTKTFENALSLKNVVLSVKMTYKVKVHGALLFCILAFSIYESTKKLIRGSTIKFALHNIENCPFESG